MKISARNFLEGTVKTLTKAQPPLMSKSNLKAGAL